MMANTHRAPAVAGQFYPAHPKHLSDQLLGFLDSVEPMPSKRPRALIVPHAGTIYSGPIAASAYKLLGTWKDDIDQVILLGPSHHVYLHGAAAPRSSEFETPLGNISIPQQTLEDMVSKYPFLHFSDEAHAQEHALEVQLPFLKLVLDDFQLLPWVVGELSDTDGCQLLDDLTGQGRHVIILSTDLSHFHDYETATNTDLETARHIESFNGEGLEPRSACGRTPLKSLLTYARKHDLEIERLDLRNSGDTAGSKHQVVGYGAWALYDKDRSN